MTFIIDSPKYGKHEVMVDDEFKTTSESEKFNISLNRSNNRFYVRFSKNEKLYLHRVIAKCYDKKCDVDHINMNTLDNRKSNLRVCNRSQNMMNRGKKKTNRTKYKGVGVFKRDGNFSAQIHVMYKKIHLGYFKTEEAAAIAYNEAAIKYHGEFAKLNIINGAAL